MTAPGPHSKPRWSVALPFYNEAAFLPRTLASLIGQDLRPLRLILVDNASSDGSAAVARAALQNCVDIDAVHVHEPRPGKIHALERALDLVDTGLVALCDADTYYPPHYLNLCDAIFRQSPADIVAVMALDVYGDPGSLTSRIRRQLKLCVATVLSRQAHTGGFGQTFRTAALRRAGGLSEDRWPYVLLDHELMHRILKIGRSRYHVDLWCLPASRRRSRRSVRWTLAERLLYHFTWHSLKDWYFYRFLGPRLQRRGLYHSRLREQPWQTSVGPKAATLRRQTDRRLHWQ